MENFSELGRAAEAERAADWCMFFSLEFRLEEQSAAKALGPAAVDARRDIIRGASVACRKI
jgi:hypothetical protein